MQQVAPGDTPDGLAPGAWESITAQIAAGPYRDYPQDNGSFQSANPAHGWQIGYSSDGVTELTPRDATATPWRWGLQLTGYGFGDLTVPVQAPQLLAAEAQFTYRWDALIDEWWKNGTNGLEQGFTLHSPPAGAALGEPLRVELAISGDLRGEQRGTDLAFLDPSGATAFTYSNLCAWDATGRDLPGVMSLADGRIVLSITADNAVYPLTIDPLVQQAYLKAANTETGDQFGFSVAISGDTLVVGANTEDSSATGVNGDQANNSVTSAGAAYVFVRNGSEWSQQAYLKASNTESGDQFGTAVAISGDTIVVGAIFEASSATGVNGNQDDNSTFFAGAAYVFVRNGSEWSQQAYLKASNTESGDQFGDTVAISGDTIVVGAVFEDSNATGVNGNHDDNSASASGAAYVFARSGTTWSQQAYLKASNTGVGDFFGDTAAISGDTIVVGALGESSDGTGVNGIQFNNSLNFSGAAYVFVRNGSEWSQQAYLKASNTDAEDRFGSAVAISGDTIVVGATGEASSATGVNGNQADNSAAQSGAAYVFVPDITPPSVTINQADDQPDPATSGPIRFAVVFSRAVTSFSDADVEISGTAPGSLTATVSGDGPTYTVSIRGMTGSGTVIASIPAGAAQDVAGNSSLASTSTDNRVTFDATPPSVTINQADDQLDPATSGPIRFAVVFSRAVTSFSGADVEISGTAPGPLTATVSGDGSTYTVSISGMTGSGTVIASIPAGAAQDVAGNSNSASTSTDNSVTFNATPEPVTYTLYFPIIQVAPQPALVVTLRDTPFPPRTAQQGEVFWRSTVSAPTISTGTFVLAGSPDGRTPALVDDEVRLILNDQVIFRYDFAVSGRVVATVVPIPDTVIAQLQGQTFTIELADRYAGSVSSSALYLVNRKPMQTQILAQRR
jgi:hypothetical protein